MRAREGASRWASALRCALMAASVPAGTLEGGASGAVPPPPTAATDWGVAEAMARAAAAADGAVVDTSAVDVDDTGAGADNHVADCAGAGPLAGAAAIIQREEVCHATVDE